MNNELIKLLEQLPRNIRAVDLMEAYVFLTLKRNGGNRMATCRETGLSLRTIRNRIGEFRVKGYPIEEISTHGRPKRVYFNDLG